MRVLLHADGGKGVGLGHASRCVALVSALRRAGHEALIVVDPVTGLGTFLDQQACRYREGSATPEGLWQQAVQFEASVIVVDSYRWLAADFESLRRGWPIVAFDDEAIRELPVDAVINGAPVAERLVYRIPQGTRLWLGPAYQVVRDEFRIQPQRGAAGAVRRLIVLVGGDDPLGLLPILATTLERLAGVRNSELAVELIYGPFTPLPDLRDLRNVEVLRNPPDLPKRMAMADLAISAAGQTLYELARCGTPTIAFCSGQDQVHNLAALAAREVVQNAGDASQSDWLLKIEAGLSMLVEDTGRRTAMSSAGQSLIDGLGADRLAEAIAALGDCPQRAELHAGGCK